jgi:hypothetical protein
MWATIDEPNLFIFWELWDVAVIICRQFSQIWL